MKKWFGKKYEYHFSFCLTKKLHIHTFLIISSHLGPQYSKIYKIALDVLAKHIRRHFLPTPSLNNTALQQPISLPPFIYNFCPSASISRHAWLKKDNVYISKQLVQIS